MLRRTAFSRSLPPARAARQWTADELPGPRIPLPALPEIPMACAPIEKDDAIQHEGYINLVRGMACARCGYSAKRSQFCHADEGKGSGIKTDCRRGWPGCGPHDGMPGCHWLVGTSGRIPKEERRAFERAAGARTRAAVLALGQWPSRLPLWIDEVENGGRP